MDELGEVSRDWDIDFRQLEAGPFQGSVGAGGKAPPYEDWTREELYDRARELDIEGRSDMAKDELIEALRSR